MERLHDLRHSYASLLISKGADIATVSQRLGHSSKTMTLDVYTHSLDKKEEEIIDIIEKL